MGKGLNDPVQSKCRKTFMNTCETGHRHVYTTFSRPILSIFVVCFERDHKSPKALGVKKIISGFYNILTLSACALFLTRWLFAFFLPLSSIHKKV